MFIESKRDYLSLSIDDVRIDNWPIMTINSVIPSVLDENIVIIWTCYENSSHGIF